MFARQQLNELAERRRLLVIEADLHRSLITLERESLRARLAGLQEVRERVTSNKPLVIAGSAVAGLLAARHWRKLARWLPPALTALHFLKSLRG